MRHEGLGERFLLEDQEVDRRVDSGLASEVTRQHRLVGAPARQLDSQRKESLARTSKSERDHGSESCVDDQHRQALFGMHPMEANPCFPVSDLDRDLLRAHEALVPRELLQRLAEVR